MSKAEKFIQLKTRQSFFNASVSEYTEWLEEFAQQIAKEQRDACGANYVNNCIDYLTEAEELIEQTPLVI